VYLHCVVFSMAMGAAGSCQMVAGMAEVGPVARKEECQCPPFSGIEHLRKATQ
jgi:hypothetical protein